MMRGSGELASVSSAWSSPAFAFAALLLQSAMLCGCTIATSVHRSVAYAELPEFVSDGSLSVTPTALSTIDALAFLGVDAVWAFSVRVPPEAREVTVALVETVACSQKRQIVTQTLPVNFDQRSDSIRVVAIMTGASSSTNRFYMRSGYSENSMRPWLNGVLQNLSLAQSASTMFSDQGVGLVRDNRMVLVGRLREAYDVPPNTDPKIEDFDAYISLEIITKLEVGRK